MDFNFFMNNTIFRNICLLLRQVFATPMFIATSSAHWPDVCIAYPLAFFSHACIVSLYHCLLVFVFYTPSITMLF